MNGRFVVEPVKVQFLFDFGSPNAYLAQRVIPDIERRTGVKFDYVPVLLGGIFKRSLNIRGAQPAAASAANPRLLPSIRPTNSTPKFCTVRGTGVNGRGIVMRAHNATNRLAPTTTAIWRVPAETKMRSDLAFNV